MFAHNPDKNQQNWTVEDAIAQAKDGPHMTSPLEEMKFQVLDSYYKQSLR